MTNREGWEVKGNWVTSREDREVKDKEGFGAKNSSSQGILSVGFRKTKYLVGHARTV